MLPVLKCVSMKIAFSFIFALMLLILVTACKDDDGNNPDPQPQPQPTTYNVSYELNIFGGYQNLEMSYFEANNIKRFKSNPKTPWNTSFGGFIATDSVALRVEFTPLANKNLTYEYTVKITKGSEYINGSSFSNSFSTGDNPLPIFIEWATITHQ